VKRQRARRLTATDPHAYFAAVMTSIFKNFDLH
jgi:hypothetical protein